MRKIKRLAAQGDVLFIRRDELPNNVDLKTDTKTAVVAHSETGHHHVATAIDSPSLNHYTMDDDILQSFIVAKGDIEVRHQRSWDTHEPLTLLADNQGGDVVWEIRRQREYTPEGWRRVED